MGDLLEFTDIGDVEDVIAAIVQVVAGASDRAQRGIAGGNPGKRDRFLGFVSGTRRVGHHRPRSPRRKREQRLPPDALVDTGNFNEVKIIAANSIRTLNVAKPVRFMVGTAVTARACNGFRRSYRKRPVSAGMAPSQCCWNSTSSRSSVGPATNATS